MDIDRPPKNLAQFGKLGAIRAHNQGDFYLGMDQGKDKADETHYGGDGTDMICPAGHTREYCTGFNFGATLEDYKLD